MHLRYDKRTYMYTKRKVCEAPISIFICDTNNLQALL